MSARPGRGTELKEESGRDYQYCALPLSLWNVRPWMVRYCRMEDESEAVELVLSSPSAESASSSCSYSCTAAS